MPGHVKVFSTPFFIGFIELKHLYRTHCYTIFHVNPRITCRFMHFSHEISCEHCLCVIQPFVFCKTDGIQCMKQCKMATLFWVQPKNRFALCKHMHLFDSIHHLMYSICEIPAGMWQLESNSFYCLATTKSW